MARPFREIMASDVGKPTFEAFGRIWSTSGFIGRILPGDVGKRVYLNDDVLQVENDEQRSLRLGYMTVGVTTGQAGVTLPIESSGRARWQAMYIGALAALIVPNVDMAKELADRTASDEECIDAIRIMRQAREGDRTWPALEYLRKLRATPAPGVVVRREVAVPGRGGACFKHRDVGAQPDCSMCGKPGNVGSGGAGGKAP